MRNFLTMRRLFFIMAMIPFLSLAQESINLQEARQMALEHNRQLKIDQLDNQGAALQTRSAFTNYLPRFDAEGAYQRRNKPYKLFDSDKFLPLIPYQGIDSETGSFNPAIMQDPELAPEFLVFNPLTGEPVTDEEGNPVFQQYAWLPKEKGEIGQKNNYQFGITLSQPLFMGGKIRSGHRIAQKAEKISEINKDLSISQVVFRTDELFWQVVALEEKLELSIAYLEMLDKLVQDLENLFEEGIVTRNQVLQAQVKYNEVELLKVKAENGLHLSRMALNQMLGQPLTREFELDENFEADMLLLDEENIAETAMSQRPELQMLNQSVSVAAEMIKVKRADMMPSMGLKAGYSYSNPNPYNGFKDEFGGDYSIGVGISIPIYHFGDKRREVAQARIEKEKMQLKKDDTREMIELQVNQSMLDFNEAMEKTKLTHLSLKQAKENLDVTNNLFREGRATTRDVLEAQAHWQEAQAAYIEAKASEKLAYSKLQKNLGNIYTSH